MTLANLLTERQILPDLKSRERWEAITELVGVLADGGVIRAGDRETILESIRQREQTMSTGIGLGIAIPHASSDRVRKVVAAFGRSRTGLEFNSLDDAPVHFVVLFVVPKDQFQTHLRTLAAIAKFLNDRVVREELLSAGTAEEIMEVFRKRSPKT